jgi:hypothetical protein
MKRTGALFLTAAVLVLTGCERDGTALRMEAPPRLALQAFTVTPDESQEAGRQDKEIDVAAARLDQKLIRSAVLHLEVGNIDETMAEVASIVADLEGLVADSQVTRGTQRGVSSGIVIRVPWTRLDDAVSALKKLGRVDYERVETRDVTRDYVDLETRLAVKRETAARLREMLKSRAGKLEELLAVERELSRVIEEIERHEAGRRYYDRQIAMSTVTLQLTDERTASGPAILAPVGDAFGRAVEVLVFSVATLVYAGTFIVPWLCLAAAMWWLVRAARRHRGEKRSD